MASGIIEHEGIVSRVEGDRVYVKITSQSACGACKAREACGLAEAQEKIVEVTTPGAQQHYTAGESVTVGVRRSAGAVAVILAYVGALAVLLGAGMSIGLFFLLPTLLGSFIVLFTDSMVVRNVAESLLKMAIFVGYLA